MTETLGPYSYGDVHRVPGRPLCAPMDHWAEGFEVRVVDESNQPVAEGGIGEIQVRSAAVTPAIHKMSHEKFFTPDGFLRTGDMGQRSEEHTSELQSLMRNSYAVFCLDSKYTVNK